MDDARAWSDYWKQTGDAGVCVPGAPPHVESQLIKLWAEFGAGLDVDSTVLDLATGTGAVLRAIGQSKSGLRMIGVDFAELPAPNQSDFEFLGNTQIEALPFSADSMDAITSQFGFEYAEQNAALLEIARVGKAGAKIQLIMHHCASPIVSQNTRRLAALEALHAAGVAKPQLTPPTANSLPAAILRTIQSLAKAHADQTVVSEIGNAIAAAYRIGGAEGAADLEWIAKGMTREIALLSALSSAAQNLDHINAMVTKHNERLAWEQPEEIIIDGETAPLAWLMRGAVTG